MDYLRFAASSREACDEFERDLALARSRSRSSAFGYLALERLAFHYRRLLHDHALASARFPGTEAARRLHRLVLAGTRWLQQDTGQAAPSVRRFYRDTFPRALRRQRPVLALTAALFAVATSFGLLLAAVEPSLASIFLPPPAIEGLREGRLWTESVFAVTPAAVASSAIATNNLSVALAGWAGGAAAGLGGLYIVFFNGLMLGVVVAVTWHYSLAPTLLEFVAAHGPLEITLILVTAAAGLDLGRALVAAEDRPRREALREASRDALAVLSGSLPWIVVCAAVEGYVSPSPQVPAPLKASLGGLLLAAFLSMAFFGSGRERSREPSAGRGAAA